MLEATGYFTKTGCLFHKDIGEAEPRKVQVCLSHFVASGKMRGYDVAYLHGMLLACLQSGAIGDGVGSVIIVIGNLGDDIHMLQVFHLEETPQDILPYHPLLEAQPVAVDEVTAGQLVPCCWWNRAWRVQVEVAHSLLVG